MTDQDKENVEILYTGFAMLALIIRNEDDDSVIPEKAKAFGRAMVSEEDGILGVKPKKKYVRMPKGD